MPLLECPLVVSAAGQVCNLIGRFRKAIDYCAQLPLLQEQVLNRFSILQFKDRDSGRSGPYWKEAEGVADLIHKVEFIVRKGFKDTRVEQADYRFIPDATKIARDMIGTHAIVVLGQTGSGKTTLINTLMNESTLHVGLFPEDATKRVAIRELKLQNLDDDANILLIDTEGWTSQTSTNIKESYRCVLMERRLTVEHTPHVIVFCVQVTSFKSFTMEARQSMQQDFKRFHQHRQYPITVVPVATFADTIPSKHLEKAKKKVEQLAKDLFQETGATVIEPLSTCCKEGEQFHGIKALRVRLRECLLEQLDSEEFRKMWWKALAKSLAHHTQEHFEKNPSVDAEWGLYLAAYQSVVDICAKSPMGKQAQPVPNSAEKPPWWLLSRIPHATEVLSYRQYGEVVWQFAWKKARCHAGLIVACVALWLLYYASLQADAFRGQLAKLQKSTSKEVSNLRGRLATSKEQIQKCLFSEDLAGTQCLGLSLNRKAKTSVECQWTCCIDPSCNVWNWMDECWTGDAGCPQGTVSGSDWIGQLFRKHR